MIKIYCLRLLHNSWWVLSAICFFVQMMYDVDSINFYFAILSVVLLALIKENFFVEIRKMGGYWIILPILCVIGYHNYYGNLTYYFPEEAWYQFITSSLHLSRQMFDSFLMVTLFILSAPFLITVFCVVYNRLRDNIFSALVSDWSKMDYVWIIVVFSLLSIMIAYLYNITDAFYPSTSEAPYDVIASLDSPIQYEDEVWVSILHRSNDEEQPLYAIASIPFFAPIYIIKRIIPASKYFYPIIVSQIHIILSIITGQLLAYSLVLSAVHRRAFSTFYISIYSTLLFMVGIEQYTVCTFWLAATIYGISKGKPESAGIEWLAATGSLITSGLFLPLINIDYKRNILHQVKTIIYKSLKWIGLLVLSICIFMRFDQIILALSPLRNKLEISEVPPLIQYLHFPYTVILHPINALTEYRNHMSWRPIPITHVSTLDILFFIVSLLGILLCFKELQKQKKLSTWICTTIWIIFSFVLLGIIGYGAWENCYILYGLYFGWAYFIGFFFFIRWVLSKLKSEKVEVCSLYLLCAVVFVYNFMDLQDMAISLSQYFPIV